MTVDVRNPQGYRILSLDGGGICGVFPAAFLAKLEQHLEHPVGSYFDLIAGTSTGGIIAIALGLGLPASTILGLYEDRGPTIFGRNHRLLLGWAAQQVRRARHLFTNKYDPTVLRAALEDVLGERRLGESRTRLIIPSWHPVRARPYVFKTAHHPRFENDYRELAADVAMATAAAPTYLPPHSTADHVHLIDGGVWANNPIGAAVAEAIGLLKWPSDQLKVLSIGTTAEVRSPMRLAGLVPFAFRGTELFMIGQSQGALATAMVLTGHNANRRAIWRINQIAPGGRYALDDVRRIGELKDRAFAEAREWLSALRPHFFGLPAPTFAPYHDIRACPVSP